MKSYVYLHIAIIFHTSMHVVCVTCYGVPSSSTDSSAYFGSVPFASLVPLQKRSMSATASPASGNAAVCSTFVQAYSKENIKSPCHWPFVGVPPQKWQLTGKILHVMTSLWQLTFVIIKKGEILILSSQQFQRNIHIIKEILIASDAEDINWYPF